MHVYDYFVIAHARKDIWDQKTYQQLIAESFIPWLPPYS